jgi:hypothetical protein
LIKTPQKPTVAREPFRRRDLIFLQRFVVRKNQVRARQSWPGDNDGKAVGPLDPDAFLIADEQP